MSDERTQEMLKHLKRSQQGCRVTMGHGESCVAGYLCGACQSQLDAAALIERQAAEIARLQGQVPPPAQKCPRCGFMTANVFDCPTCKTGGRNLYGNAEPVSDQAPGEISPGFRAVGQSDALPPAVELWQRRFEKQYERAEAAEAEARQLREQLERERELSLNAYEVQHGLEAQLAACERDAARYRRIRNVPSLTMANGWFRGTTDLDDAVDAAMSAKEDK